MKIPRPISGGLMLSYKCPAECRHCMYACSPKWMGDWITVDRLEQFLPQLAKVIMPSPYGRQYMSLNHGLHFSGGEPFLNFKFCFRYGLSGAERRLCLQMSPLSGYSQISRFQR